MIDFKFIMYLILFLLIVFLLITIIKDIDVLKSDIEKLVEENKLYVDEKLLWLKNKINTDNTNQLSKLKKENNELVEQVRKISLINSQKIKTYNEFMTADTSESSNNFIGYLSDQKKNNLNESTSSVFLSKTNKNIDDEIEQDEISCVDSKSDDSVKINVKLDHNNNNLKEAFKLNLDELPCL